MMRLIIALLLLSMSFTVFAGESQPLSSINAVPCNGCTPTSVKSKALQKAKEIGFYDPITEIESPTTVYIFNFNTETIQSFDVWNKRNLFTGEMYTVFEKPHNVDYAMKTSYSEIVGRLKEFFNTSSNSDYSGYDFLQNSYIQQQVLNEVNSNLSGYLFGLSLQFKTVAQLTGIFNNSILDHKVIIFKDGVKVTIRISDLKRIKNIDIFLGNAQLEYMPDSAYVVDSDGNEITKIPDDANEAKEHKDGHFEDRDAFYDYFNYLESRFGFDSRGSGSYDFQSRFVYCKVTSTLVKKGKDSDDPDGWTWIMVYTCSPQ